MLREKIINPINPISKTFIARSAEGTEITFQYQVYSMLRSYISNLHKYPELTAINIIGARFDKELMGQLVNELLKRPKLTALRFYSTDMKISEPENMSLLTQLPELQELKFCKIIFFPLLESKEDSWLRMASFVDILKRCPVLQTLNIEGTDFRFYIETLINAIPDLNLKVLKFGNLAIEHWEAIASKLPLNGTLTDVGLPSSIPSSLKLKINESLTRNQVFRKQQESEKNSYFATIEQSLNQLLSPTVISYIKKYLLKDGIETSLLHQSALMASRSISSPGAFSFISSFFESSNHQLKIEDFITDSKTVFTFESRRGQLTTSLISELRNYPNLSEINISNVLITEKLMEALGKALMRRTNLKKLNLHATVIEIIGLRHFSAVLSSLIGLQELDLSRMSLVHLKNTAINSNIYVSNFLTALIRCSALEVLNIEGAEFRVYMKLLIEAIPRLTHLKVLKFGDINANENKWHIGKGRLITKEELWKGIQKVLLTNSSIIDVGLPSPEEWEKFSYLLNKREEIKSILERNQKLKLHSMVSPSTLAASPITGRDIVKWLKKNDQGNQRQLEQSCLDMLKQVENPFSLSILSRFWRARFKGADHIQKAIDLRKQKLLNELASTNVMDLPADFSQENNKESLVEFLWKSAGKLPEKVLYDLCKLMKQAVKTGIQPDEIFSFFYYPLTLRYQGYGYSEIKDLLTGIGLRKDYKLWETNLFKDLTDLEHKELESKLTYGKCISFIRVLNEAVCHLKEFREQLIQHDPHRDEITDLSSGISGILKKSYSTEMREATAHFLFQNLLLKKYGLTEIMDIADAAVKGYIKESKRVSNPSAYEFLNKVDELICEESEKITKILKEYFPNVVSQLILEHLRNITPFSKFREDLINHTSPKEMPSEEKFQEKRLALDKVISRMFVETVGSVNGQIAANFLFRNMFLKGYTLEEIKITAENGINEFKRQCSTVDSLTGGGDYFLSRISQLIKDEKSNTCRRAFLDMIGESISVDVKILRKILESLSIPAVLTQLLLEYLPDALMATVKMLADKVADIPQALAAEFLFRDMLLKGHAFEKIRAIANAAVVEYKRQYAVSDRAQVSSCAGFLKKIENLMWAEKNRVVSFRSSSGVSFLGSSSSKEKAKCSNKMKGRNEPKSAADRSRPRV